MFSRTPGFPTISPLSYCCVPGVWLVSLLLLKVIPHLLVVFLGDWPQMTPLGLTLLCPSHWKANLTF
jgi:hypothetical protein